VGKKRCSKAVTRVKSKERVLFPAEFLEDNQNSTRLGGAAVWGNRIKWVGKYGEEGGKKDRHENLVLKDSIHARRRGTSLDKSCKAHRS